MADLDAAGGQAVALRNRVEGGFVMHFRRCGIDRGPLVEDRLQAGDIVEIGVFGRDFEIGEGLVAEDFRFTGIGQDDEFVAVIAADRAGIGAHRDGAHAEPRKGAQIGDEHLVIGMDGVFAGHVEGIGILHQEFARAHGAETRADLVAELQLDMIEVERQALVGLDVGPEDIGDHFLIGRAVEHRALLAVLDAQHFLAIGLVTAAFLPEFGGLQGRHDQFDGAGTVLFLADDGVDLVQHLLAERQPGIDALALLTDHARAQHQAVRDDFRFLGIFLQDGHKIAGQAHGDFRL